MALMNFNKKEWSYIFYDWAESSYTVIVSSFIFPMLYSALADFDFAKSIYAFLVSGVSLVVALLSPILGTISDYYGFKKKFFLFFFALGLVFTALISIFPTDPDLWWVILIPYTLSAIGYSGTNVFYDSFIVDATSDENMDRVSTAGYAFGYIGGSTIPLILALLLIPDGSGANFLGMQMPYDSFMGFRIIFLLTAFWWLFFAIPFVKNVTQVYGIEPEPHPVKQSFIRLWKTFLDARHYRGVFIFLIAFFLYIDGVHTVISMAVPFAEDAIQEVKDYMLVEGSSTGKLLPVLLVIQIVAFFFALLFARLSRKYSTKSLLLVTIGVYSVIAIFAAFITEMAHFWILGLLVATSQGAIQSLSRSYFGKIIPKNKANEFFGLYTVFGRFAAIFGPAIVGGVALFFPPDLAGGTLRYGVSSLIILFILGGVLFLVSNKVNSTSAPQE